MGLRLYQPPVESDIKTRPSAEKILSQARGISRHSRISLSSEQQRERRRRLLAGLESRNLSPPRDRDVPTRSNDTSSGPGENAENGRNSLREAASRMGTLDERMVAMFGERWAHLHADTTPLRDLDEDRTPPTLPPISAMAVEPGFFPRRVNGLPAEITTFTRRAGTGEPYTISNLRSTHPLNRPAQNEARATVRLNFRAGRERDVRRRGAGPEGAPARYDAIFSRSERINRRRDAQTAPEFGQVDGLGDRNRSLSPEGDNVWDTLLSTLTPDPTPPSLGSSFVSASGSASAAASQSAATRSSATSFTGPDTIEESALEQPCESACENSDTEGDEDDEAEENPLLQLISRSNQRAAERRRTYADVVSRNSSFDDPLDIVNMQRIVRTLADREDIPDEWWAQVGLSRTLSREASTT